MEKDDLARRIREAAYLEGDFVLRSGRRSKYYLDKYLFAARPDILAELARRFAERLGDAELIAGAELGAVSLAAATSLAAGTPFVIVRKAAKGYGTDKQIEGPDVAGRRVMLVEDIGTTAGAALEAARVLEDAGATVTQIVFAVDRREGAGENVEAAGYAFDAMLTRDDIERAG
ncbi:MAG: orotate phosphoribosyltransferase [Phycisphaerae bacterium]|nr:orotate phosphoribosyltransferase [Phycisphaerae bacterium]